MNSQPVTVRRHVRRRVYRGRRHVLTAAEQLRGVEGALRSRKTPSWLKKGLRKRKEMLQRKMGK